MKKIKLADGTEMEVMEAADLAAITGNVTKLADSIKLIGESSNKNNVALLKKIEEVGKVTKPAESKKGSGAGDLDNKDLELMSRKEFMGTIMEQVKGIFEDAMKPLKENIDTTKTEIADKDFKAELKAAHEKHPDLMKWKDEIGKMLTENPNLSVERAYKLVRDENPTKGAEMDKEFKLENGNVKSTTGKNGAGDDGTADDDEGESGKSKALGLTPTSGKVAKSEAMSTKDASQAAWDEVMSGVDLGENV